MPYRPLALVSALTAGDFVLWNWSLSANQTVLALIAGLTLPPLAAACALVVVITAARLVGRIKAPAIPAIPRRRLDARRLRIRSSLTAGRQPRLSVEAVRTTRARGDHAEPDERELAAATADARKRRRDRKLAA